MLARLCWSPGLPAWAEQRSPSTRAAVLVPTLALMALLEQMDEVAGLETLPLEVEVPRRQFDSPLVQSAQSVAVLAVAGAEVL